MPMKPLAKIRLLLIIWRPGAPQFNIIITGPRVSAIEKYLFAYDLSLGGVRPAQHGERDEDRFGFRFGALLSPNAYARLQQLGVIREIEFAVSVPGAREADLAAGRSLSEVLSAPLPKGVETITIKLKAAARRNSALGRQGVMGIVNDVQRLGDDASRAKCVANKPSMIPSSQLI
jgi:hypothetical protein